MARKKPRIIKGKELLIPQKSEDKPHYFGVFRFLNNTITTFNVGGKMSEQGADDMGRAIAQGFNFFLKTLAIGAAFALFFWQLPNLAEFIIKLKQATGH